MARCQVKQGFFLLKECENPARYSCNTCGKAVCEEHSREYEGHRVCTDCLSEQKSTYDANRRSSDSSLRVRREYRSSRYYSPYYYGHDRHRSYDEHHVRDDIDANEFDQNDLVDDGFDGADDDFDFMDS